LLQKEDQFLHCSLLSTALLAVRHAATTATRGTIPVVLVATRERHHMEIKQAKAIIMQSKEAWVK